MLHPSLYPSIHHLLILPCISFLLFFPSWHQSHHSKCFIHLFLLPGLFILFLSNSPLSSLLYINLHSLIVLPVCTFVIVAVNCCWLTDQFRTGRTLIYSFSAGKYKPGMCEDMRMHANTHTHTYTLVGYNEWMASAVTMVALRLSVCQSRSPPLLSGLLLVDRG